MSKTRLLATLITPLMLGSALSETLYSTDFEDFEVGANQWSAFDGWRSSDDSSGAQAIDSGLFNGALGKTAALGFTKPASSFTTVFRNVSYDPGVDGNPLIEFQTLFGIEDSTNNFRDSFFFSFYNIQGDLLASIRLSNRETDYGIWRRDGNLNAGGQESATETEFVRSELHNLNARIDLSNNTWSASLDGIPLFENATFNGTGKTRTLGPVAAEWELGLPSTSFAGNNWMLVADFVVETVETEEPPLVIDSIARNSDGSMTLAWAAHAGYTYQVEYSDFLESWKTDLPGSRFESVASDGPLEYTDDAAADSPGRFYRLTRSNP